MKTRKEMATERARLYPSTYKKIRIQAARQEKTIAQVVEENRIKAKAYDKLAAQR